MATVTGEPMKHDPQARAAVVSAGIAAISSIVVAVITALVTLRIASADLRTASDRAAEAQQQLQMTKSALGVPVGSIVASLLSPGAFAVQAGDPGSFDATKSQWALADGREVSGSTYVAVAKGSTVPDLRGMFLRGVNANRSDEWKDPGGERATGSLQEDSTRLPRAPWSVSSSGAHSHTSAATGNSDGWDAAELGGPDGKTLPTSSSGDHSHAIGGGDVETRPRNAAVYYYVRIN